MYRIMLDAAIMGDHKCLYYTASPNISTRQLFDPEYYYRTADWGGGYPRPLREIVNNRWRAKQISEDVIPISEDPNLSNKALREAFELKNDILVQRELEKERKRRDKIDKI